MLLRDFYQAFSGLTKFEIVGPPSETTQQVRLIGRVRARAHSRAWATQYVEALVQAATNNGRWSTDISRYYFERDGEVLWAWRVIIKAGSVALEAALEDIIRVLQASNRAPTSSGAEITELPLVSVSPLRNTTINGRGAQSTKERK